MSLFLAVITVPEEWLTAFVVATIGAIGAVWLKAKSIGRSEGENSREVTIKDQPVKFEKSQRPVSFDQHAALDARVARMEAHHDAMQRDQAAQYKQILDAGAERETRLMEFFGAGLREVNLRLDQILNRPPTTRR